MESSAPQKRPSQQQIARLAGVSAMTVSLALRNHTSITEATRERVRKIAADCGYLPDPLVGKLMQQLRAGRQRRAPISMCALVSTPRKKTMTYEDYIVQGAQKTAEQLGYFFEKLELSESRREPQRLRRLLRNRGVEGILLTPMWPAVDLSGLVDWADFSVVSTSVSVLGPLAHRVLPDQFGNALELCQRLNQKGYRRLGLVTSRDHDSRTGHRVAAAVQWQNTANGVEDMRPLVTEHLPPGATDFKPWMEQVRPDVIISDSDGYLAMFCQAMPELEGFPMATTSVLHTTSRFPGIHENPGQVGVAAVELLSALFQHGERGIPKAPQTTLIPGVYNDLG